MNILVINGSPKGDYSVTLQTILYLEKCYPQHHFTILPIGQKINRYEKRFEEILSEIKKADLLLFSYPVYTFIAPSQLHRFIELLKEADVDVSKKFVTQITTSKHFYDVSAHRYIQENVQDLKMKYIKGLSADMDDLLQEKGQKQAKDFFAYVEWCMQNNYYEAYPVQYEKSALSEVSLPNDKKEKQISLF